MRQQNLLEYFEEKLRTSKAVETNYRIKTKQPVDDQLLDVEVEALFQVNYENQTAFVTIENMNSDLTLRQTDIYESSSMSSNGVTSFPAFNFITQVRQLMPSNYEDLFTIENGAMNPLNIEGLVPVYECVSTECCQIFTIDEQEAVKIPGYVESQVVICHKSENVFEITGTISLVDDSGLVIETETVALVRFE